MIKLFLSILITLLLFNNISSQVRRGDQKINRIDREKVTKTNPHNNDGRGSDDGRIKRIVENKHTPTIITTVKELPKREPVEDKVYIQQPEFVMIEKEYVYIPVPPPPPVILKTPKEEGIYNLKSENYYDAITFFNQAIRENKKDIELYYLRGLAELGYEDYENAIIDFTYYLKFFDDDGEAYYRRGLALFFLGEKEKAEKDLISAVNYGHKKAGDILNKYF